MSRKFLTATSLGFIFFTTFGLIGIALHTSWIYLQHKKEKLAINVYLDENIGEEDKLFIGRTIKAMAGVKEVEYIGGNEAKVYFIREYPNYSKAIDLFKYVPLPEGFRVTLKKQFMEQKLLNHVVKQISSLSGVSEVSVKSDWAEKLTNMTNLIEKGFFFAVLFAALSVIFIMPNAFALIFSGGSKFYMSSSILLSGLLSMGILAFLTNSLRLPLDTIVFKSISVGMLICLLTALIIHTRVARRSL